MLVVVEEVVLQITYCHDTKALFASAALAKHRSVVTMLCDSTLSRPSLVHVAHRGEFSVGSTTAMDNNTGWRHNYDQNHRQQHPQDSQTSRAAAASVHDAQALLAVYPMASATPTNHGKIFLGHENHV